MPSTPGVETSFTATIPDANPAMNGAAEPEADFLLDDAPANAEEAPVAATPWLVLIVDDDESVHSISRVVLADVHYQGRGVEILSAYSGPPGRRDLRVSPDVAVVLLDVVMEADDAGLKLVREIREQMRNTNCASFCAPDSPARRRSVR